MISGCWAGDETSQRVRIKRGRGELAENPQEVGRRRDSIQGLTVSWRGRRQPHREYSVTEASKGEGEIRL